MGIVRINGISIPYTFNVNSTIKKKLGTYKINTSKVEIINVCKSVYKAYGFEPPSQLAEGDVEFLDGGIK